MYGCFVHIAYMYVSVYKANEELKKYRIICVCNVT